MAKLHTKDNGRNEYVSQGRRVAWRWPLSVAMCLVVTGLVVTLTVARSPKGKGVQDAPRHMMAKSYYFREPTDRAWQLRVVGSIPSLPGCYYIMHDTQGRLLLRKHIPHGNYTDENPLVIDIPKDGRAGDYRLQVLGQQEDILGPRMPISTLPFEVYGRHYFTAGRNKTPIYFKVELGVKTRNISASKGNIRVYQGETLVADTKAHGKLDRHNWTVDFPVKPGIAYRIERECFYFRSTDGLLLTFDPDRWFVPDPKLDLYNWWKLIGQTSRVGGGRGAIE